MKISIYDDNTKLAYNPNTMESRGVGGTQTIIINLAKELAKKGHDVTVFIKCNFPDIYDNVKYYQYYDYKPSNEDLLIGFESLPDKYNAKKVFNFSTRIAVEDVMKYPDVDHLLVLSKWQKDRYASELPSELVKKIRIIKPGVSKDFFKPDTPKWPLSITYTGHPCKGGMKALIEVMKRLRPKFKEAKIHVYGGGRLWGWNDEQYRPLYNNLIKNGILYHGQGGKSRMRTHLNSSQIFIYPSSESIKETFCLAILEAMAAGCVIIASDSGNVKNLIKDVGYVIDGNVSDYKWSLRAIEIITDLFNSKSGTSEIAQMSRKRAKKYTWAKTIKSLEKLF